MPALGYFARRRLAFAEHTAAHVLLAHRSSRAALCAAPRRHARAPSPLLGERVLDIGEPRQSAARSIKTGVDEVRVSTAVAIGRRQVNFISTTSAARFSRDVLAAYADACYRPPMRQLHAKYDALYFFTLPPRPAIFALDAARDIYAAGSYDSRVPPCAKAGRQKTSARRHVRATLISARCLCACRVSLLVHAATAASQSRREPAVGRSTCCFAARRGAMSMPLNRSRRSEDEIPRR